MPGEMFEQVLERGILQAFVVGPGRIAEDTVQPDCSIYINDSFE